MSAPDPDHQPPQSPFNDLPLVVVALAVVLFGLECLFSLGEAGLIGGDDAIGWRISAIAQWGFGDVLWERAQELGTYPFYVVIRFFSYAFIHQSFTDALFAIVILLAMGNFVGRIFHPVALLAIVTAASAGGAFLFSLIIDTPYLLTGAFPAAYGLIGAYTFLLWVNLTSTGGPRHQAFTLILFLAGIQLVFALIFGSSPLWVADIAAFGIGFGLSFVVSPGGWQRVLAKIRRD